MQRVQVIALQRQCYGGVWQTEGSEFDVTEAEASEMESIRPPLIKRNDRKDLYASRTMQAVQADETPSKATVSAQPSATKGKYDRRDLRAR